MRNSLHLPWDSTTIQYQKLNHNEYHNVAMLQLNDIYQLKNESHLTVRGSGDAITYCI